MDPPAEKGGSPLNLPFQSCHTRASRGTHTRVPSFPPPTVCLLFGIDRLLPKAVVPRDKQSGSSCVSSNKLV